MKKKTFLVVLLTFLISLSIFACGKVSPLGEYTDFNGVNNADTMSIDENMTIDGVLSEDVWTNSKNKLTAENAANGKKMDVYTYLGENGVYFAFDVKDNALFYNPGRRQSRNTGVELYLTTLNHFTLEKGCVSVRLAPTGEGNEVAIEYYRPNAAGNEWTATKAKGKYLGAAVINGTMNSEAKDSEGYTAELAVSWELLGVESADVIQYTASFVQALRYDGTDREANTFFAGTTHTGVGSWKAVSNDGYIEDKYSYVDENTAVYDDFMNIDGVLDEEEWTEFISAGKGKTFTHNNTGISLTINTLMTDKGLYIGLDSNDNDVYYSEDRAVKFNTGVELFVAGNGTTTLNEENVIQIRYNVGGPGDRYQVNLNSEYPYKSNYFPARIAGSVKNGVMNSSETEGWQGEVFLPWSSIGVTEDNMKNQAAILACIYHCESATATSSPEWQYISVTGGDVFGNNSHNVNPQQSFFLFTKDSGFIPNGISVSEVALSKVDLNSDGTAYEHIVTVSSSDAITLSGFTTEKPAVIGAIFDFGEAENVSVTDRSDGTYIISIPQEDISYFNTPRKVTVTANGADAQFNVSFDGNFTLDGILDDNVYDGLNHIVTKAASGIGNVESDFVFALNQKAMYVGIEIKDALVNTDTQWGSGVEMYFNFGETLSSANTYQVRLYADESARYYVYMDEAAENGFSWKEDSSLVPEISIVSNITSDGYIIEARIPWSLFGLETAPENCGIAALTKFATNENKSSFSVRYDKLDLGNEGSRVIENYLNFDETGFAPEKIYASDVVFVKGMDVAAGNYSAEFNAYYVSGGAIAVTEGVAADDYTGAVTNMTEGTYSFTLPQSVVEAIDENKLFNISAGTASGQINVVYIEPSAEDFDDSKILSYVNFDEGLNAVAGLNTSMRRGEASFGTRSGSYSTNRYYTLDMKNRALKLDNATVGIKSFTVSMMINGDDIKNCQYTASNGYALILFGTGNVDGSEGFSVRVRYDSTGAKPNAFQIKVLDQNDAGGTAAVINAIDGWQRWTVTFDRSVTDTLTVSVYIDAKFVYAKQFTLAFDMSLDGASGSVFGIGAGGLDDNNSNGSNYLSNEIGIDDFMLYDGIMTQNDIYNFVQYVGEINLANAFNMDDISFTFSDVDAQGYSTQFLVNAYLADGSVISLDDTQVTFGDEIAEFITYVESGNEGHFLFSVTEDNLSVFIGGLTSTYTYKGISKEVTISYVPLSQLYLDKETVIIYTGDRVGDNYEFTVGVYADSELSVPVTGVTFSPFTASDNGDGTYNFVVPATQMESAASHQITATKVVTDGASIGSSFTVNYISWTASDVAENTEVYLNFDGSLINYAGSGVANTNGAVYATDDDYTGDQAYVANMQKRATKLGVTVGTGSFVISTMINGADLKNLAGDGYATAIVATGNIDGANGFSIRMRTDTYQIKVLSERDAAGTSAVLAAISEDWQRWTFVFDRTVEGKLVVSTYVDGVLVYTSQEFNVASDVSLDVEGYGTIGIGAPGCKPDMDNYPASTNVDVRYDDFMFYRGYMNAQQVQAIDGYIESMKENTSFVAEDVLFDYNTPGIESGYTQDLVINKVYPQVTAITSDIAFDGVAAAYISLSDGKYVLSIPAEDLETFAETEGVTVNYTYLGITKSFIIKYVKMGELYVDEIEIFDLELNADNQIVHSVRVSADTEGLVGVGGVNFGEIAPYVTEGETTGDYLITLTAEQANSLPAEIEISASGVSKTVKVSYTESLINNVETLSLTGTTYSTDTQGGKVFAGVELGTDSFTVSATFGNISNCESGGGYALFSTANADFWDGITCYVNTNRIRFKFAGVNAGSSVDISGDFTKYNEWTNFVFHFDRSDSKSITITVYADGELVGTKTTVLTEDLTFDYGASKNFVLGGYNLEAKGQTSSFTGAAPVDANSFGLTSAAFAVTKGIVPVDIAEAYLNGAVQSYSIDASSVKADFGFNDGTTANSVSESGVAMELNAAAASSVVAGREGGEDKAIQINSTSMYYDVNGFDPGVNSFTVSMWLKMDFSTALTTTGSGIVLFATTDPAAKTGFAISVRKDFARLWIAAANNGVAIDNTAQYTDWTNWTFSFTHGAGKCVVNVYVNFALAATSTLTVADDVSLSNPENASFMGIGRGVEVSGSEGGEYENGVFRWYENNTHTVDDIVIIDKELNAAEVLGLMNYYKA